MHARDRTQMTQAEYLARERVSETRHEYVNGASFAMAGGSPAHSAICANVLIALGVALRGKPCRVYDSNLRVHVAATGLYTYPDAAVVCGRAEVVEDDRLTVTNPTLLVEVLSEGTEGYDRGAKFRHYQSIASLREVLLVASEERRAELFRRLPTGQWLLTTYEAGAGELTLESVGASVSFEAFYAQLDDVPHG